MTMTIECRMLVGRDDSSMQKRKTIVGGFPKRQRRRSRRRGTAGCWLVGCQKKEKKIVSGMREKKRPGRWFSKVTMKEKKRQTTG